MQGLESTAQAIEWLAALFARFQDSDRASTLLRSAIAMRVKVRLGGRFTSKFSIAQIESKGGKVWQSG
jgi:hypothetical protein